MCFRRERAFKTARVFGESGRRRRGRKRKDLESNPSVFWKGGTKAIIQETEVKI